MGSMLDKWKAEQAAKKAQAEAEVYAEVTPVKKKVVVAAVEVVEAKRGRGRPVKADKLSKAEIQARWRAKRKAKAK
ncbi:hypothetical protein EVB27_080 [Rhizobium phage RHph_TM16]|nr:hypothetical protein EVB27_080 [Rhizobium phage RHph_TM16]